MFEIEPPRLTHEKVTGKNWYKLAWKDAEVERLDSESCKATVEVPSNTTLLVATNKSCSDYKSYLGAEPSSPPYIGSFELENSMPRVELSGWRVAEAFLKQRGICVFRYTGQSI